MQLKKRCWMDSSVPQRRQVVCRLMPYAALNLVKVCILFLLILHKNGKFKWLPRPDSYFFFLNYFFWADCFSMWEGGVLGNCIVSNAGDTFLDYPLIGKDLFPHLGVQVKPTWLHCMTSSPLSNIPYLNPISKNGVILFPGFSALLTRAHWNI